MPPKIILRKMTLDRVFITLLWRQYINGHVTVIVYNGYVVDDSQAEPSTPNLPCHAISHGVRCYDPLCGAGAEVLKTWQQAQLEPNTLIETEYLSANAQARAEALRLETFEEEGKFVITRLEN